MQLNTMADGLGTKALGGVTVGGATSVAPRTPVAAHDGLDSQTDENLVEMHEVSELRPWHIPNRATSRIALASDFGSASSTGPWIMQNNIGRGNG
jgi:hypothetical protein